MRGVAPSTLLIFLLWRMRAARSAGSSVFRVKSGLSVVGGDGGGAARGCERDDRIGSWEA